MLRNFLMTTVIASAMVGSAYAADLAYRPALRKTGSKLLITHGARPKAAIKPLVTHRTLPVVHANSRHIRPGTGRFSKSPKWKGRSCFEFCRPKPPTSEVRPFIAATTDRTGQRTKLENRDCRYCDSRHIRPGTGQFSNSLKSKGRSCGYHFGSKNRLCSELSEEQ